MRPCLSEFLSVLFLAVGLSSASLFGAERTEPELPLDLAGEPYVYESLSTSIVFDTDGREERTLESVVQILSEAGVQQLGQLVFPFVEGRETLHLETLRVTRPNGTTTEVSPDQVRAVPAPLAADFPVFSNLKVLHVIPPALRPGDRIELRLLSHVTSPIAPGQFFFEHSFERQVLVRSEVLEIELPAGLDIRLRTNEGIEPTSEHKESRRTLSWTHSYVHRDGPSGPAGNLERPALPDIEISTFEDWAEVGAWYQDLAAGRSTPDTAIAKKVNKLLQGADSDDERIHRIYAFVSKEIRYLGVFLGAADYQPQAASEVLENGYGDCKDKHTLLQAMLAAAGYEAEPVLLSSFREIESEVPSPRQFNHMVTAVTIDDRQIWMDSTLQVAPYRYLLPELRGKLGLLVPSSGDARLTETPEGLPFTSSQQFVFDGRLDKSGQLSGRVEVRFRGDDEVFLRANLFAVPVGQQRQLAEGIHRILGLPGQVSDFRFTEPTATDEPFKVGYSLSSADHLQTTGDTHDFEVVLPKLRLPENPEEISGEHGAYLDLELPIHWEGHSSVKLPAGFSAHSPTPVELHRGSAEYKSIYEFTGRVLRAERALLWKDHPLPASRRDDYSLLRHAIRADLEQSFVVRGAFSDQAAPTDTSTSATQALVEKGRQAAEEENHEEAIRLFTEVVEREPDHESAWGHLGRALTNSGNPQGGVEALRRQIEVNPLHKTARSNLGWSLEKLGDDAGAEAAFREQLEVNPLNTFSTRNLGRLLEKHERCEEALPFLEKAVSLDPSDGWSKLRWARCLHDLEQTTEAISLLENLAAESDDPPLLDSAGLAALRLDKPEIAVTLYMKATELDPADYESMKNLAFAQERAGRTEEAIETLRRVVESNWRDTGAWYDLALFLLRLRRDQEGLDALRNVIELAPDDVRALGLMGGVLVRQHKYTEAIEVLEKARGLGTGDIADLIFLGRAYSSTGRLQAAVEVLRSYLSEVPENQAVLDELGGLYFRQGNFQEAANLYQQLAQINPAFHKVHSKAGFALFQLGEFDEARPYFVRALEFDQNDFPANRCLGIILAREERDAEALVHLEKAKALAPGFFSEAELLEYVRGRAESQGSQDADD